MTYVVLLLILGFGLLVLEFCVPSWGLLTLASVLCVAAALQMAYEIDAGTGFWTVVAVIVMLPGMVALGSWLAPYSPIVLRQEPVEPAHGSEDLVGRPGQVVAPLRPIGTVQLEGDAQLHSATCELSRLPRGTAVRVVGRREAELLVEPIEAGSVEIA